MINLPTILKVAAPIVGAIITDTVTSDISPKKQENIYAEMVPQAINTVLTALADSNDQHQQSQIERPPIIVENPVNISPYEIAKNKTYRYSF